MSFLVLSKKPRRKHRRVRSDWTGCHCPEGTRKVSTCTGKTKKACRGRGWGCLGVGRSQKGKRAPRFFAAVCAAKPKALPPPRMLTRTLLLTS